MKPIILDVECIVCNKSLQKINHILENTARTKRSMGKVPSNRRIRTPNWSLEEKQHLLELIKERKEVVVTKSNNGPNHSEEKDVAWNEILRQLAVKFGSKFNGSSIKKVKTQWQNMKRIAREEISLNGTAVQNYTRQSLEVCNLLEIMKDGVLKKEGESMNETTLTTNVEIKAECIEEEMNQPSCSTINNISTCTDNTQNHANTFQFHSSSPSVSELNFDVSETNSVDNVATEGTFINKKDASAMTDNSYIHEATVNPYHREIQEYFKFTAAEKQIKIDSLKEERQVMRAMRETAELHKIIAEQKLNHVIWVKKQEMA